MRRFILHLFLIAVSALASWWFLLRVPDGGTPPAPRAHPRSDLTLTVSPEAAPPAPAAAEEAPEQEPPLTAAMDVPSPQPVDPPEEPPVDRPADQPPAAPPAPPPAEAGTPDGDPEEEAAPETPAPRPDPSARVSRELREIESSPRLMEQAKAEVSGKGRKGFHTTFLCSARDQLDIARFFGEPVILVPRAGLRPGGEYYHRLTLTGEPGIEEVRAPAPLTEYRQYRDLFAFNYDSLPTPLRELRRRVFVRGDIYLFAALIPAREWGLVMLRRDAALAEFNRRRGGTPRTHDDVRSFTMRYVRLPGGAFDIEVASINFDDQTVVDTRNGGLR